MKKVLMTMVAAVAAVSMNAQVYLGGNVGFSTSTDKTVADTKKTTNSFTIAPEIGMSLDDKMGVGIVLGFGTATNKTEFSGALASTPSVKRTTTSIDIRPYLRYQIMKVNKFNVFVDGGVDFSMDKTKDMKPAMDLGLFVTPGIAYNVSKNWSIVAKLNDMFSFGYHKDAVADIDNAPSAPTSLNAELASGGFNVGNLTFGVYYNF